MTQKQRLIEAFKKGKSFTTYSATVAKLTTKLPTRIGEMEREGFKFIKTWKTPKNIKAHFVYKLDFKKTPK
jgi:hypothetical protein